MKKRPHDSPKKKLKAYLFIYLEPQNAKWARTHGRKNYRSISAYMNTLITLDKALVVQHRTAIPL